MSVRRAVRATAAGRTETLPERLRSCTIEDWVTPTDRPPEWWWAGTIVNANDRPGGRAMAWLQINAWTRHQEALDQWAEEHGMNWSEFLAAYEPGVGEPRWRDWWSFKEQRLEAGL